MRYHFFQLLLIMHRKEPYIRDKQWCQLAFAINETCDIQYYFLKPLLFSYL